MTISYNVPEKRLSKAIKQAHKDFFESFDDEEEVIGFDCITDENDLEEYFADRD